MSENDTPVESLLTALKERAKELNCLYDVEELFSMPNITLPEIAEGIVRAIPEGWQYPDVCVARIRIGNVVRQSTEFEETPWQLSTDLIVQDEKVGEIVVAYREERPSAHEGPFLREERKLINTIADRLERRILHENLRAVFEGETRNRPVASEWQVILDLLQRTDPKLLARITKKMVNHLAWIGVAAANALVESAKPVQRSESNVLDENQPARLQQRPDLGALSERVFEIARTSIDSKEILSLLQKWIKEDRSGFLVRVLENPASSLAEIANAIDRFHHLGPQGLELSFPRERSFRVSLIRRLLTDQPDFIGIAKQYLDVDDFYQLLRRVIHPAGSHGKLGGKGSGLFLASKVLEKASRQIDALAGVRTPKTWYLTSDGILKFINSNDLEEIVETKYEDLGHIRQEYPYTVNIFKNSPLPAEIVNGLSMALDDFGDVPLIVRSSSLLEDRMGASFAGKYKSLFIANQGTKRERLSALIDAITEVYASTFGPDPIEYRAAHGLLDFHEEMGILIQEVIGRRLGRYFLPAFAGVAFSSNDFRWSKRIRREDGLLRMVPGLGTRAVDRMADDYPILVSPGQPNLRPNVTPDEKIRYSPRKADVIDLETNSLETVDIRSLFAECGEEYPNLHQLVSILREDRLEQPTPIGLEPAQDHLVVTMEGLITRTPFVEQIKAILDTLTSRLQIQVDIEFAHDGETLYLLQCRPQSRGAALQPATIPREVPAERVLFSASRHVPNGTVSSISHVVYVDPIRYGELTSRDQMVAVGRAVGRLNQLLPKRQFILLGPGRWGSRGDIRLGVSVTYSDINNSAMLLEIARRQRDYVPELSFGTHFFQDLVESGIRYLPLYPDEEGVVFNETFLRDSENILESLLPDCGNLSDTIRVIDVPDQTGGRMLEILMNGETDDALAILTETPSAGPLEGPTPAREESGERARVDEAHWRWRLRMVEHLASLIDPQTSGVRALYVFGSTKNATAGPESDIDILVEFTGNERQMTDLKAWLEGWSQSLGHMNYLRTGRPTETLLDVHFVTEEDIKRRSSFASKIGAATDAARPLRLGRGKKSRD
jgi:predicted nucleotidyltransferase